MINGMSSYEYRGSHNTQERVEHLEKLLKECKEAMLWAADAVSMDATAEFETDAECHCPLCNILVKLGEEL